MKENSVLEGPRGRWIDEKSVLEGPRGRWIDENSVLEGPGAGGSTEINNLLEMCQSTLETSQISGATLRDVPDRPGGSQRRSRASCCAPETSQCVLETPRASPERSQDVLDQQK